MLYLYESGFIKSTNTLIIAAGLLIRDDTVLTTFLPLHANIFY